jgi:hypothetical protein
MIGFFHTFCWLSSELNTRTMVHQFKQVIKETVCKIEVFQKSLILNQNFLVV